MREGARGGTRCACACGHIFCLGFGAIADRTPLFALGSLRCVDPPRWPRVRKGSRSSLYGRSSAHVAIGLIIWALLLLLLLLLLLCLVLFFPRCCYVCTLSVFLFFALFPRASCPRHGSLLSAEPVCVSSESSAADMKETTSLTLKESAAFLAGNSYLRDVAILVIAYGTSINIVEGASGVGGTFAGSVVAGEQL